MYELENKKAKVEISVHNQYFKVKILDKHYNYLLNPIKESLRLYDFVFNKETKRSHRVLVKEYFVYDKLYDCYRFTKGMLRNFMLTLKEQGLGRDDIKIFYFKNYQIDKVDLLIRTENFEQRDYQTKYIEELTKPDARHAILVDLQTGKGKSYISMCAISKLQMKTVLLVVPKYMDKWIIDLKKYTKIKDDELYIVQGLESLNWLIDNPVNNFKFILFSMRTMTNYIKDYEEFGECYKIHPEMLAQHLKVGIMLSDETHEEFHGLLKTSLYFDTQKIIGLSATLDNNNKELKNLYYHMFPDDARLDNIVEIERIPDVYAIMYRMQSTKGFKYMRPKGYSHNEFEKSILRNSVFLREYIGMIKEYIKIGYTDRRQNKEKLLIFFDSIKLCAVVANQLKKDFPKLKVSKYTEQDPFSNLMESDICVSTPLSSGTAVDIPNLITVIQTVSISSLQRNRQNVGRLRKIDGRDVRYYYLFCRDIRRQYEMHLERLNQINKVAKSINFIQHQKTLRTY